MTVRAATAYNRVKKRLKILQYKGGMMRNCFVILITNMNRSVINPDSFGNYETQKVIQIGT
jgi:hypothetical protein